MALSKTVTNRSPRALDNSARSDLFPPNNNDAKEYFWGCALTKEKPEHIWKPITDEEEDEEDSMALHSLYIKQAVAGAKCKENEVNIVEAESLGYDNNTVAQPIISITPGRQEQHGVDIGFSHSVTFRLVQGSGPIHITGQHLVEFQDPDYQAYPYDDEDDEQEEEEAEIEQELSDELVQRQESVSAQQTKPSAPTNARKRKAANPVQPQTKKLRAEKGVDEPDEEDDESEEDRDTDDDDDQDMEEEISEDDEDEEDDEYSPEKPATKKKPAGKARVSTAAAAAVAAKAKKGAKGGDKKPAKPQAKKAR